MSFMKDMSDLMSAVPPAPPKFSFTLPELEILYKSIISYYENMLDLWEQDKTIPVPSLCPNNYGWDSEDYEKLTFNDVGNVKDVCVSLINKFSMFNFTVE